MPKRIHQIWLGPRDIPEACQALMEGWKEQHPSWEYRLWTDADVEEAALPLRLAAAFAAATSPAEQSDILRLWLVLQHGGLYVDVDFECFEPLDAVLQRFGFVTGLSNVGAFELNNGLFAAAPGHPLLRYLCDHVLLPWPEWGGDDVDQREAVAHQLEKSGLLGSPLAGAPGKAAFLATTGPGFFTRAVMRGLSAHRARAGQASADGGAGPGLAPLAICPPEVFYPLPNSQRHLPWDERRRLYGGGDATGAGEVVAGGVAAKGAAPGEAWPMWPWRPKSALAMHHWCRTWDPEQPERSAAS